MTYLCHLVTLVGIYSMLALSLNVVVGYLGLLSLCHAALFGIGAYVGAAVMKIWGGDLLTATVLGAFTAFALSVPIGALSLRLRGDFFVLGTLGVQIILVSFASNLTGLTGGPYGITDIPVAFVAGIELGTPLHFMLFVAVLASASTAILYLVQNSSFGKLMVAVRDDEIAALAIGKNVDRVRLSAFTLGAAIAGGAGATYSAYLRFIDPTLFGTAETFLLLTMVFIGGPGSQFGPIVGAAVLVLLPEALRSSGLSDANAAALKQIVLGLSLILLMRWRPQGLTGKFDISRGDR